MVSSSPNFVVTGGAGGGVGLYAGAIGPGVPFGGEFFCLVRLGGGKVVLFGGKATGTYQNDTWTWDGTTWANVSPTIRPSARAQGGLAYSGGTASNLVMYGGVGSGGVVGDTWTFSGTSWTQQSPAGTPGPLDRFGFTYDAAVDVPVLEPVEKAPRSLKVLDIGSAKD